jgi:hypothetical protein
MNKQGLILTLVAIRNHEVFRQQLQEEIVKNFGQLAPWERYDIIYTCSTILSSEMSLYIRKNAAAILEAFGLQDAHSEAVQVLDRFDKLHLPVPPATDIQKRVAEALKKIREKQNHPIQ